MKTKTPALQTQAQQKAQILSFQWSLNNVAARFSCFHFLYFFKETHSNWTPENKICPRLLALRKVWTLDNVFSSRQVAEPLCKASPTPPSGSQSSLLHLDNISSVYLVDLFCLVSKASKNLHSWMDLSFVKKFSTFWYCKNPPRTPNPDHHKGLTRGLRDRADKPVTPQSHVPTENVALMVTGKYRYFP